MEGPSSFLGTDEEPSRFKETRLLLHDIMVFCLLYSCSAIIAVPCTGGYPTQTRTGGNAKGTRFLLGNLNCRRHCIGSIQGMDDGSQADMLVLQ